jgi:hypothetical protein
MLRTCVTVFGSQPSVSIATETTQRIDSPCGLCDGAVRVERLQSLAAALADGDRPSTSINLRDVNEICRLPSTISAGEGSAKE